MASLLWRIFRLENSIFAATLLVLAILAAIPSAAQAASPLLSQYLGRAEPSELFAGADRFGPIQDGVPVAPVLQGDKLLGYAYLNSDFVNTTGYSGRPIHVLVGLGTDARRRRGQAGRSS